MKGKKMIGMVAFFCMCLSGAEQAYAVGDTPLPTNQNEQQMEHKCPQHSPMQIVLMPKIIDLLKMDAHTFYAELGKGKSIL